MTPLMKGLEAFYSLVKRAESTIQKQSLERKFKRIGHNVVIVPFGSVFSTDTIEIGDEVFIGQLAYFGGVIRIGNRVMFGPRVVISGADHLFAVEGQSVRFLAPQGLENARPVEIEDEAWIGANVTIIGKVTVGMGAVVGAASVVTSDVPPFTTAVGNPAKPVRRIFEDRVLVRHLQTLGYSPELAKSVVMRRTAMLGKARLPIVDRTSANNVPAVNSNRPGSH
jgi:maltose O-acetyltransferase